MKSVARLCFSMIVACHQPNYLPWPGFFYKMMACNAFVLMDSCQFPLGRSFINRNRIKTPLSRFLWLTVPVKRKGRSLQNINEAQIDNEIDWQRRHLGALIHFYAKAPYFNEYIDFFRALYGKKWDKLITLNFEIINFFKKLLRVDTKLYFLSELGVEGSGSSLLVNVLRRLDADAYLSIYNSRKYIDEALFKKEGIKVRYYNFKPPVYPQLWGEFLYNLSIIDLVLNCGEKAKEIIEGCGKN